MWDRKLFKDAAKSNLNKNYWPVVGVSVLLTIAIGATGGSTGATVTYNIGRNMGANFDYGMWPIFMAVAGFIAVLGIVAGMFNLAIQILAANPYQVGASRFFMENRYQKQARFSAVGKGFSGNFGNTVLTQFLKQLYIFLWSLLFVVPGIVMGYAYFCVPYILAENPNLDHDRVLRLSREMTMGWKGEIFVTDLSFILWEMLNGLTFGILGIFYLNPYINGTKAEIYAFLRQKALENGVTTTAELHGFGEEFSAY